MSEVYSMTFLIWETHDISPEILFYFSLISLAEYLHFFRHYGFTNNSGGMHSCLVNLLLPEKWRTCLSMVCRSFETQRYIFLLHFCSASHFNQASQNSSLLKTHFWVILCLYSVTPGLFMVQHLQAVILYESILFACSKELVDFGRFSWEQYQVLISPTHIN